MYDTDFVTVPKNLIQYTRERNLTRDKFLKAHLGLIVNFWTTFFCVDQERNLASDKSEKTYLGLIVRNGHFLICVRSRKEKAYLGSMGWIHPVFSD